MTVVQPVLTDNVPSMLFFFFFVHFVFLLCPVVSGKTRLNQATKPPVSMNQQPVMLHQPS